MKNKYCFNRYENRGLTLIEVITVMAIVALVSIGSTVSLNLLGIGNAMNTAKRVKSALEYVQIQNMTKGEKYYLTIEKSDNSYELTIERLEAVRIVVEKQKLDLKKGEITFQNVGDTADYVVGDTDLSGNKIKLEVCFIKNTGAVGKNSSNHVISEINITGPGSSYRLKLAEATGKIIMK